MRKAITYLIILFITASLNAHGQLQYESVRPDDSLYLWVNFTENNIMIDIPESYFNYRTEIPVLPQHVSLRQIHAAVPNLPAKAVLVNTLSNGLITTNTPSTREQQLKYLGKVVLLLYYSDNNLNLLAEEVKQKIKSLSKNSKVKNEALLLMKWIG